jgi:uncharacterized protein (DUF2147 family)
MRPKMCPLRRPVALSPSAAALLLLSLGLVVGDHASAATPVGTWYAEGGAAQIAIEPCGEALCGRVVWLRSPLDEDGCQLTDRHNPDAALRGRKVEGLKILWGLTSRPDGTWVNGRIYDPASGSTYTCRLALDGDDRVRLRGYVGIPVIGRTATWTRVGGEKRLCRDAQR